MEAALAKAREIAAKLAAGGGAAEAPVVPPPAVSAESELGKRRWDTDLETNAGYTKPGLGSDKRQRENNPSDNIYGPGSSDGDTSSGYQLEMRVPNHLVGYIIGKGGENISKMTAASGATMQIAKESEMRPGDTTRSIVVKGRTRECADDLKRRVEDVIDTHLNKGAAGASGATKTADGKEFNYPFIMNVPVPNDKVGVIIGRSGATIKGIQDRTHTNIQIPQVGDADDPTVRTLKIGGHSQDAVEAAQGEIFVTLQSFHQQGSASSSAKATNILYLPVPDDKVGVIIGKGGCTIKEIQNRNSVRIQIPTTADVGSYPPVRTVSIQGPPEGQNGAKYEIESLLAQGPGGGMRPGGVNVSNAGIYGGGGGNAYGGMQYGQQQAYGQYGQQQGYAAAAYGQQYTGGYGTGAESADAGANVSAEDAAAAAPTDPTAYYNDFWAYAAYYGEPAARQYYQQWSPPEGTLPPTTASSAPDSATDAAPAAQNESKADLAATLPGTTDEASKQTPNGDASSGTSAGDEATVATDDAWEAYKKQYTEWWVAYGKEAGAQEDPAVAWAAQQAASTTEQ